MGKNLSLIIPGASHDAVQQNELRLRYDLPSEAYAIVEYRKWNPPNHPYWNHPPDEHVLIWQMTVPDFLDVDGVPPGKQEVIAYYLKNLQSGDVKRSKNPL